MKPEEEQAFNQIFFGSLYPQIFDKIYKILDKSINECVSTLPFLPSTTNNNEGKEGQQRSSKEKLIHMLSKAYSSKFEYTEMYSKMRIFTIGVTLSKNKRKLLIDMWEEQKYIPFDKSVINNKKKDDDEENKVFLKNIEENQKSINNTFQQDGHEHESTTTESSIDEEIQKLQIRKRTLKNINITLLSKLQSISKIKSYQYEVSKVVQNSTTEEANTIDKKLMNLTNEINNYDDLVINCNNLLQKLNDNVDSAAMSSNKKDDILFFNPRNKELKDDYEHYTKEYNQVSVDSINNVLDLLDEK